MSHTRVGMTGMMRMVRMGGHVMQRRPIVDIVGIIVKAALTTLAQFARWVVNVRQLHDFYSVFAIQVVHGARAHTVTPRYRRRWGRGSAHAATWYRWQWFVRTLRITRWAEAVDAAVGHACVWASHQTGGGHDCRRRTCRYLS